MTTTQTTLPTAEQARAYARERAQYAAQKDARSFVGVPSLNR
jgi:hypothetical protein